MLMSAVATYPSEQGSTQPHASILGSLGGNVVAANGEADLYRLGRG
jgi:hypothetical protein